MSEYILGIDIGSTVSKSAIYDVYGDEISVSARKTDLLTPQPGYSERDMESIWLATLESVKDVLSQSKIPADEIKAVGCAGHGNGLYLIDRNGKPVRNAIMSTDLRARDYIKKWQAEKIDTEVRNKTMQRIWSAQPNALLAWLIDNEPDTIKNTAWILMCKDYIRFRLTGEVYGELTDMSGTSLLNLRTRTYDSDLLESFGINSIADKLPTLINSAEIAGYISRKTSELTGLREGTPVAAGMFDIDACGLASGMIDESKLCMIAGTWGNNQYISKEPVISANVFMTSCYSIPDYYLMLEGSATSTNNLEWFIAEFFEKQKKSLEREGKSIYQYCNELVSQTTDGESNIIFLPFLYGSNIHENAKSCLIGIDAWHNKGHIIRAVYEGTVFSHKSHVDKLLNFREMPDTIQLSGGATKSKEWVQIFADVFQVPIEVPKQNELGTLGAAIAAGISIGIYESYEDAVKSMVKINRIIEPDIGKRDLYTQKYSQYSNVLANLNEYWKNN